MLLLLAMILILPLAGVQEWAFAYDGAFSEIATSIQETSD